MIRYWHHTQLVKVFWSIHVFIFVWIQTLIWNYLIFVNFVMNNSFIFAFRNSSTHYCKFQIHFCASASSLALLFKIVTNFSKVLRTFPSLWKISPKQRLSTIFWYLTPFIWWRQVLDIILVLLPTKPTLRYISVYMLNKSVFSGWKYLTRPPLLNTKLFSCFV